MRSPVVSSCPTSPWTSRPATVPVSSITTTPSGAVSFAALLEHPERFVGRRVGVVISGGNVDLDNLPW